MGSKNCDQKNRLPWAGWIRHRNSLAKIHKRQEVRSMKEANLMKLAKVLTLCMALILAFVFISAPVAISGGGSTDKHPWDEDGIGNDGNRGGFDGYIPGGEDNQDDPDAAVCGTGVIWLVRNISVRNIVQIVTLYKGATVRSDRGETNTGSKKASVR